MSVVGACAIRCSGGTRCRAQHLEGVPGCGGGVSSLVVVPRVCVHNGAVALGYLGTTRTQVDRPLTIPLRCRRCCTCGFCVIGCAATEWTACVCVARVPIVESLAHVLPQCQCNHSVCVANGMCSMCPPYLQCNTLWLLSSEVTLVVCGVVGTLR